MDYKSVQKLFDRYSAFCRIQGLGDPNADPKPCSLYGVGWQDKQRLEYCLRYFPPSTHPRALAVGAGDGFEVKLLTDAGFNASGITMNRTNVDNCPAKYGVSMSFSDLHFVDQPDASHDFIYSSHSFEHSLFPVLALAEWSRLLSPNGMLFIEYPKPTAPQEQNMKSFHHVANLDKVLLTKLAGLCGFEAVDFTEFGYIHCPEWTMNRFMFSKTLEPCQDYYRLMHKE